MAQFCREDLLLLSRVLLSRLTRPNTVEINIIQDHLVEPPLESNINIERIFGRFVGCFSNSSTVCFYLAARAAPDEQVSHVFVYYLNSSCSSIQDEDMNTLRMYIPELRDPTSEIKLGLVSVNCHSDMCHHLSLFVEAIEFTLGSKLVKHFKEYHVIDVEYQNLSINPFAEVYLSDCDGSLSESSLDEFMKIVRRYGTVLKLSRGGQRLSNPNVALVEFKGHFVGIVFNPKLKTINCITVHNDQLEDKESYDEFTKFVDSFYESKIVSHYITRLRYKAVRECNDKMFKYGLMLILEFLPHVFVSLKKNEMLYIIKNHYRESALVKPNISPYKRPARRSSRESSGDSTRSADFRADYYTKLRIHNNGRSPEVLSDIVSSQATEIVPHVEMSAEISFWKEISKERQQIRDVLVPPVHKIEPFSDFTQSYLKFMPCYETAVQFMAKLWSQFANTVVVINCNEVLELPDETRFIIYPSRTLLNDEDFLIIIDVAKRDWIYLQLGNEYHKNPSEFDVFTRRFKATLFPKYSDLIGRAVPIVNGNCHEAYPKLHLLMSLYVIFRLFRYSVQLPQKIIFGEWELRKYANNICTQLQVVNSEYNIDNNLVDSNGYLTEEAMQSLPSPLKLETGVVPKDQCMFCKRRGFSNLGRHMIMQHGGQAHLASHSRSN